MCSWASLLSLKRTIATKGTSTRLPVGSTPGNIQSIRIVCVNLKIISSFAGEHETVKVSLGQETMVAGEGNHVFESRALTQACLPLFVPNFAYWFHSRK